MRCILLFLATSTFFAVSTPIGAQPLSGNDVFEECISENQAKHGFCIGYITGLYEGQYWGGLLATKTIGAEMDATDFNSFANRMFQHCVPPDATNQQLRDVVVKYLVDNPANRHKSARYLVWEAYQNAFPCQ